MMVTRADEALALWCRRLAALLRTGLDGPTAVGRLRAAFPALARLTEDVAGELQRGSTLSAALAKQPPDRVPLILQRAIVAGEAAQDVPTALDEAGDLLDHASMQRRNLMATLAYPKLMTLTLLGLLWILFDLLGSNFARLFSGMNLTLPLPTRVFIACSEFFSTPLAWLLLLAVAVFCWIVLSIGPLGDSWRQHVAIVGSWLQRADDVTWLRWTDYFLARGQSLEAAVRQAAQACFSNTARRRFEATADEIAAGSRLSVALQRHHPAHSLTVWLVGQAEAAEFRDGLLRKAAMAVNREFEQSATAGLGYLQPLLILALGCTVLWLLVAMFLPMYQLLGTLA
jgi:type II secretory pathway component PulF